MSKFYAINVLMIVCLSIKNNYYLLSKFDIILRSSILTLYAVSRKMHRHLIGLFIFNYFISNLNANIIFIATNKENVSKNVALQKWIFLVNPVTHHFAYIVYPNIKRLKKKEERVKQRTQLPLQY